MQWFWLSWQSGCFQYQRSAVRIQSLVKFIEHLFTVNHIEKAKIKKKRPGMAHFFKKRNETPQLGPAHTTMRIFFDLRWKVVSWKNCIFAQHCRTAFCTALPHCVLHSTAALRFAQHCRTAFSQHIAISLS